LFAIVGGDVATGPLPRETLDQIMALGARARFVRGNADREIVSAYDAGSVGMPYEGRPGAYWALFGPGVELRPTEYELDGALEELRAGRYPDLEKMLQESVLEPADPDEVDRFFERSAIRAD
jgi:hypothetical protein